MMRQDIERVLMNARRSLSIREIEYGLKQIGYPSIDLYKTIFYYLNYNAKLAPNVDKSPNTVFPRTYRLL